MYCIKCGADNLETAKFCRKCGGEMSIGPVDGGPLADGGRESVFRKNDGETVIPLGDVEEETRVVRRNAGLPTRTGGDAETDVTEAELFAITPTLLFVKAGYALAFFATLFFVAICSVLTSYPLWMTILIGLILGLPLFLLVGFYHIRQKFMRYSLTESKLEIDKGFISRTTRNVPIRRIQDVTVSSNVFQRLLGFGDLVIDNASEEGGKAVLKNINTPKHYADVLLKQMRRLDR